jgi:ribosomal subunit interface protein
MQPVKIVIRDMPNSPALESHIRKKAEKLAQFYNRINTFQVVVDIPQKHKHNGKMFNVRIDLTVPGRELVVNRNLDQDVYVAIRDAFHALLRQLETYVRKRRGEVKSHDHANYGHVTKLFPDEGYGFIQSVDGNELYFSYTNVTHPTFDNLIIGDAVQFIGVTSNEGWQAHRITKEKKNNLTEEIDSL